MNPLFTIDRIDVFEPELVLYERIITFKRTFIMSTPITFVLRQDNTTKKNTRDFDQDS